MSKCHVGRCFESATVRVKLGNNHSFKDRWTGGIDYCDDHGNKVGCSSSDRGMRVLIEDIEVGRESQMSNKPLCWCDGEPTCTGVSDEGEYGLCRSCRQMGHSKLQPLPFSMLGEDEEHD